MEIERIFSAEQIKIHPELPKIIKDYSKAVIKAHPEDIIEFSYIYFKERVENAEKRKREKILIEETNSMENHDME